MTIKSVLITGGHGYIGRNLTNHFRQEAISMLSVDKKKNTYTEDVSDLYIYDGVVHLSAISGIPQCEENKTQAFIDNVVATINIMEASYKYKIPLVFASSQAARHPGNSFYALSKWMGEQQAMRLNKKGAKIRVLRFSNVYGGIGWEEKTNVVAVFRRKHDQLKPLIVNGDGSQKRDFIHVYDLCRAITMALKHEGGGTKPKLIHPMDIGTGKMASIKKVAEMISSDIEYNPDSGWIGVMENVADITPAKDLLGFESDIDISRESIYM